MKREAVEEFVSSVVEGIIAGTEMELVDVDYVRERDWYLRVYLDKPGGVDSVSYTHLDVYKRQPLNFVIKPLLSTSTNPSDS